MRVHPMSLKRNVAVREGIDSGSGQLFAMMEGNPMKKLRKLPHVFGKVLELPFRSDADVAVEEGPEFFRFVAEMEFDNHGGGGGGGGGVRVQAVEIHTGITKIVVRNGGAAGGVAAGIGGVGGGEEELLLEELKVDTWRFRLPATTKPELATAVFVDGELIVTVPKAGRDGGEFADGKDVWGGGGRLVLVQ